MNIEDHFSQCSPRFSCYLNNNLRIFHVCNVLQRQLPKLLLLTQHLMEGTGRETIRVWLPFPSAFIVGCIIFIRYHTLYFCLSSSFMQDT